MHDPGYRDAGAFRQPVQPVGEQRGIAAEFVNDQPAHQRPFFRLQQFQRADQRGEHAPPVDVAAEQHRGVGVAGHPHIDDFGGFEVDFRRAAGALGHHDVEVAPQAVQRVFHRAPKLGFQAEVVPRPRRAQRAAQQHHLGGMVGLRLEQHRVHCHPRLHAGGVGLHRLRPPDFAPGRRHIGVVGHILRLERGHPKAVLPEDAAQRRNQHALADVGGGALHHQHLAGQFRPWRFVQLQGGGLLGGGPAAGGGGVRVSHSSTPGRGPPDARCR